MAKFVIKNENSKKNTMQCFKLEVMTNKKEQHCQVCCLDLIMLFLLFCMNLLVYLAFAWSRAMRSPNISRVSIWVYTRIILPRGLG